MFKNKKNAKIVAVTVVVFFLLGIVGIVLSQSGNIYAAPASNIGKVNYARVVNEHPGMAEVEKTMESELEQAKKDFEAKSQNMNDQEKMDYYNQLSNRLRMRDQDLRVPIYDKINATIKAVAEAKKLDVVFDSGAVLYGGVDITDDVIQKSSK